MSTILAPPDLEVLRTSTRNALTALTTSTGVRRAMASESGWDLDVWARLTGELGLPGLLVPEACGGSGLSLVESAVVFEEAGAVLSCSPLFATAAMAVPLLLALGDDEVLATWATPIAAGTCTAAVADPAEVSVSDSGAGATLSGRAGFVVDGAAADLVLVPARTEDGLGVYAVSQGAPGLRAERLMSLDQTRRLARLEFEQVPAQRLATGDATAALAAARRQWITLLAAEQVGGAQRCLDVTAEYARTRYQFSRPIGSFQAVKQRLAEMLIQVESARSAAGAAAEAAATGDDEFPAIASMAALTAMEAFASVSAQMIQLHGGIGFTWEHDAHLYFKRARSGLHLFGTAGDHAAAIAEHLEQTV